MKKLHILGLAISAALCVPMAAQASDGTITFNGTLNASTCAVTTGTPAGTFTVTLPTLPAASLSTAGMTAGTTAFSIAVSGCTGTEAAFSPFFESGATTDVSTGRLNNTGSSTNVQLQLLNSNNSVINAAAASGAQGVLTAPISGGAGLGHYAVRYYATGVATAGSVSSTLTYSMVYI